MAREKKRTDEYSTRHCAALLAAPSARARPMDGAQAPVSELIERLQALHEKATPGPWESRRNAADCPTVGRVGLDGNIVPRFAKFADAALVAAMRNALPDLLAAAKAEERGRRAMQAAYDALDDTEGRSSSQSILDALAILRRALAAAPREDGE